MDHMTQPLARDARDLGRIEAVVGAADADAARAHEPATVEYGSGWYHDAEIAAAVRAPAQKH